MNIIVPLQNALEQNRFKEVVDGVVSSFEHEPLNAPEIVQLGELALKAIRRDPTNKKFEKKILKKLAAAYIALEKFAQAKNIYKDLVQTDAVWEDQLGLLKALASIGEIEELRIELIKILARKYEEKQILHLKKIEQLLIETGALAQLCQEVNFNIACMEGNVEAALSNISGLNILSRDFIRDANWESSALYAATVADKAILQSDTSPRLIVKKLYNAFMNLGEDYHLLKSLLHYFEKYKSNHIGFFFNQNSGLKVELPSETWIDEIFKIAGKIDRPSEIEVELDMGEDLFAQKPAASESPFKRIETLERRIAFLLKHNEKDEAKRLHGDLITLDPQNKKFSTEFKYNVSLSEDLMSESIAWGNAWQTLKEIEEQAKNEVLNSPSLHVSWKQVDSDELLYNYREYAYALIHNGEDESCLELLEKIISISIEDFKDASYLKARCCLRLARFNEAKTIAESILESCILSEHEVVELKYLIGESYEGEGDFKKALKVFKDIHKVDPKYRLVNLKVNRLEQK